MTTSDIVDWLLQGDPAISWRVHRDLLDSNPETIAAKRQRIGEEGWGRRLLDQQGPDGRWSADLGPRSHRGLYMPKWVSTHYTLLLLVRLGLPSDNPAAAAGCQALLERASWLPNGGIRLWTRNVTDVCVCAMVLSILQSFNQASEAQHRLRQFLLDAQLADGGWNCERQSNHGSFHTTLSTLEAFAAGPADAAINQAITRGRQFFLEHQLYCSHRTGKIARPALKRLIIPYSWHVDALRGLEHFATATARRDNRLTKAITHLRQRQRSDGRWLVNARASGKVHFEVERAGKPSRWVTARAMKILHWWDNGPPATKDG